MRKNQLSMWLSFVDILDFRSVRRRPDRMGSLDKPTASSACSPSVKSQYTVSKMGRGGWSANELRHALFRYIARQGKWKAPAFFGRYQTVSVLANSLPVDFPPLLPVDSPPPAG